MINQYKTIDFPAEGLYKEKGSKFIAYAFPLKQEEDIKLALDKLKKMHPKARHFCYAYRLGLDESTYRANDDGEPSGSAGRPILGQIDSFGLTNSLIVVVRYFGGTKLGVPGLIRSYKTSAKEALLNTKIIEKTVQNFYKISFDYKRMSDVMGAIKSAQINIVEQVFEESAFVNVSMPRELAARKMLKFKARLEKISEEQVAALKEFDGVEIKYINTI